MILSISLSDSCVLLKWFSLAVNENESGDFSLPRFLWVFPPYISCVGKNFRLNEILKVSVIDFLNNRSLIVTCFGQLHDSVLLAKDAFLSGVWSKFITKDNWVERRSTRLAIWCWNINFVSFFVNSGISSLDLVHFRFVKHKRLNILLA